MVVLNSISYIGVIVAAVAGMLVGFLWYSDFLFVKKWMELSKISSKQLESSNMVTSAGMGFGVTFILTLCLASMYHYFGDLETALMALEFLIFFVAIEELGKLIWERIPLTLYLINVGHKAVSWLAILLVYVAVLNMTS
jgi:hypothetical protein